MTKKTGKSPDTVAEAMESFLAGHSDGAAVRAALARRLALLFDEAPVYALPPLVVSLRKLLDELDDRGERSTVEAQRMLRALR